jgi:hypothetical protein
MGKAFSTCPKVTLAISSPQSKKSSAARNAAPAAPHEHEAQDHHRNERQPAHREDPISARHQLLE